MLGVGSTPVRAERKVQISAGWNNIPTKQLSSADTWNKERKENMERNKIYHRIPFLLLEEITSHLSRSQQSMISVYLEAKSDHSYRWSLGGYVWKPGVALDDPNWSVTAWNIL